MLGKKNRYSFKKGVPRIVFASPFFVVRYQKSEEEKLFLGVVVGKKVDKRAVVRNRVKRQLVERIKNILSKDTPYEIVIYARKAILELDLTRQEQELRDAFQKIKII